MADWTTHLRNSWKSKSSGFLLVVLPLISVAISLYYSVNIPQWDDYNIILGFLNDYASSGTLSAKLAVLFSPSSNYLFVILRLLAILDYTLFGTVDFSHLVFLNGILHIGIYLLLLKLSRPFLRSEYLFLPIALLIAIPTHEVQSWAAYTVHVAAVFFTLLTLYIFSGSSRYRISLAFITATCSLLSAPLGFLTFLIALVPVYHQGGIRRVLIWVTAFALVILAYFFAILPLGTELTGPVESRTPILVYLVNIIVFYGSFFKAIYQQHHLWGVILGLGISILLAGILPKWKTLFKSKPVLTAGILLAILLPIVISLMRSRHGMGATTTYRYRLYQCLPLVFLYLYFGAFYKKKLELLFPLIFCGSIFLYGIRMQYNISELKKAQLRQYFGVYHYQTTGSPSYLSWGNLSLARDFLEEAKVLGVYDYEAAIQSPQPMGNPIETSALQPMQVELQEFVINVEYLYVAGWAWTSYTATSEFQILVQLRDEQRTLTYPTGPLISSQFGKQQPESGFAFCISKDDLVIDWDQVQVDILLIHPIRGLISRHPVEAIMGM